MASGGGSAGCGSAVATPQQTPQAQQGWGSRPEFGDFGVSQGADPKVLQELIKRFERQKAEMRSKNQLSPAAEPSVYPTQATAASTKVDVPFMPNLPPANPSSSANTSMDEDAIAPSIADELVDQRQ